MPRATLEIPDRLPSTRPVRRRTTLAAALVLLGTLAGCDNPWCAFGPDGCQEGDGDGSDSFAPLPASLPSNGSWILPGPPSVVSMRPSGSDAHPDTPIVITFSESISRASLQDGFEIVDSLSGQAVPPFASGVAGDGRMVVLLVPAGLLAEGGTYAVRFTEGGEVSDLTGQPVSQGASADIGNFTVSDAPPTTPRILTTLPGDQAGNQSDLGEIVVVFDRPMDPDSFDQDSFHVLMGGGAPPQDPGPQAFDPFGIPGDDGDVTSVWRWAAGDVDGTRVPLAAGATMSVELSGSGDALEDQEGNALPAETIEYDLAPFGAPLAVDKAGDEEPQDAIGRPDLTGADPVLEVLLGGVSQEDDVLEITLFGQGPGDGDPLRALTRTVAVDVAANRVPVDAEGLDLLSGGEGLFADGDLTVAVALRRDGVRTATRLSDVSVEQGLQPFRFDVTPPQMVGLGLSGTDESSLTSDLRDLVVIGRANEQVVRVEVTSETLDNGAEPDAAISRSDGLFVAQPVPVGVLGATTRAFEVTLYDRAHNPQATSTAATFRQVGGVGPGPAPDGALTPVNVWVFDAATLAPVQGALVVSHGNAAAPVDDQLTGGNGFAQVVAANAGEDTLVTVDRAGYDLFTFHGVPTDVLQVPLHRSARSAASSEGDVVTLNEDVGALTSWNVLGDTRRDFWTVASTLDGDLETERLILVDGCIQIQGVYQCSYGPDRILPQRLGAQSFLSLADPLLQTLPTFDEDDFLQAFTTRLGTAPVASDDEEDVTIQLLGTGASPEGVELHQLQRPALAGDVAAGYPQVLVEGICPGLRGALPVGVGLAFPAGLDWDVVGAFAGEADADGELVPATLSPALRERGEILDDQGNRVGARVVLDAAAPSDLVPPNVPAVIAPAGAVSYPYDVVFDDVLPGASRGLHRAVLQDGNDRRWHVWRLDLAGSPITLRLPDVTPAGGVPLADGPMTVRVSAFSWSSFASDAFLWTDLEREPELYAHSREYAFDQVP